MRKVVLQIQKVIFYTLGDDFVFGGVSFTTDSSAGDLQGAPSAPATFIDDAPLREDDVVPDEHDVFVSGVSIAVVAPVKVALAFDVIDVWLAENDDPDAPVQDEPSITIRAKRSFGGSDLSNVKWAMSTITSSLPKDLRVSKARMSSSKRLFVGG
ncbi:hypothetical protein V6N13_122456 [Hibiscus sabdariffa]